MQNIVQWLESLINFPQLSFLKYIVASVILLVFIDAIISFILGSVNNLFRSR